MLKKFNREELNQIINTYLHDVGQQVKIKQAILFGSYAKGSATELSDIDLLIVSNDLPQNRLKTSNGYFLDQLVDNVNPSLEVIAVHPEDLKNDISKSFFEEVFRTGILIKS